jgi:predicted dehydrogenase
MKFLIAGFGSIGRRHFRNLVELGNEGVIFYRTSNRPLPDDELKGFVVEKELSTALGHYPDAVIIANPTAMHLDVAIPAAQQGCHILLEKPISSNLEKVNSLQTAVKQTGCQILMGFQFRFHPGLQKAKQLLDSGELGQPISANAHWGEYLPDWHPGEDYRKSYSARSNLGGGVVLTLSHPFDYLRWLLGEVTAVSGRVQNTGKLELDVEDLADVDLEFANGARGAVHLDYLQKPSTHWLEIECSGGKLHFDAIGGLLIVSASTNSQQRQIPVPDGFERNDLFLSEMSHFIDVVSGKTQPVCTLDDGIRALQISLAIHQSSNEGRKIDL